MYVFRQTMSRNIVMAKNTKVYLVVNFIVNCSIFNKNKICPWELI
jgi:hypothetical protein